MQLGQYLFAGTRTVQQKGLQKLPGRKVKKGLIQVVMHYDFQNSPAQGLFSVEMVVEGGFFYSHRLGNILKRCALIALFEEESQRFL